MVTYRPEYPRPQFVRSEWLNLNGEWQFEIDSGDSGFERGLVSKALKDTIIVPFCPESKLSGIGNTDFMNAVWYRKITAIPKKWEGKKVLLHFQAVDYDATVWVNNMEVCRHRGGFTPFTCDLSGIAEPGKNITIIVRARDKQGTTQPRGKQSETYQNQGCHYTRTTGIWQTVWMEPVPQDYLKRPRITPDVSNSMFHLKVPVTANHRGYRVRATLKDAAGDICTAVSPADCDFTPMVDLKIPENRARLWSPRDPFLYDITLELLDGNNTVIDSAASYAGLRSIAIDGKAVKINGNAIFQRLVLDQGYYPDGIMTAPGDDALKRDIELGLKAGFNGARLHQKIFEERFLYHADKLGYLVWGEFPNWGYSSVNPPENDRELPMTYAVQWLEALERDYSHPSIIGWCALNEVTCQIADQHLALSDAFHAMFYAAKAFDTTRPVIDSSGWSHLVRETDIWDGHDYEQDPRVLKSHYGSLLPQPYDFHEADGTGKKRTVTYRGQPYFVSEFGGTWWNPNRKAGKDGEEGWGYGDAPKTLEEFYERFDGLCGALIDNPEMFGYCYTQLTDVFQEQNGIYYFDRKPKFDLARLNEIQQRQAAIERKPQIVH